MSALVTVLAYHAIGGCSRQNDKHNLFVTIEDFADQMAFLARKRRVIDLDQAVSGRVGSGPPAVAITFDDGYRNVLELAAPILERHGFTATVFVPTAYLGGRNTWIEDTTCDVDVMNEEELQVGERRGLRMESHGHAHIDYSKASADDAHEDLTTSLDVLEKVVGRRPKHFAYPFGAHSRDAYQTVKKTGIATAYTIDEPHGGEFAYERVQITPLDGARLFRLKTSGRYMKVRHARPVTALYGTVKPAARRLLRRGD